MSEDGVELILIQTAEIRDALNTFS